MAPQQQLAEHEVPLLLPAPDGALPTAARVSLGWQFLRRQLVLLRLARAAPAAVLLLVSLLQAGVTAQVGAVASGFYQLFLDGSPAGLPRLLATSAALYLASAAVFSLQDLLQQWFAWSWRARLTRHLQALYHRQQAFHALGRSSRAPVDTPDQRLAADLPQLTTTMAEVLGQLAAVPFSVAWYTWLTRATFGSWLPVLAANLFFLAGSCLQRLAMGPVASRVMLQEAAEGAFRTSHARLLAWGAEVALYRPAPAELQHLQHKLDAVLSNQLALLWRRTALAMTTKLLEYSGLAVNYGCLALAVFGGWWREEAERSPGGMAARVSLASFYLLTLVYSYTQVLDLAGKLSDLAGLTARVSGLLEALQDSEPEPEQHQQQQHCSSAAAGGGGASASELSLPLQPVLRPGGDQGGASHERYASQAVLLQPPLGVVTRCGSPLEYSIHSLGSDLLEQEVKGVFPAAPRGSALLACVTFQFCGAARAAARQQQQQQQQHVQLHIQQPEEQEQEQQQPQPAVRLLRPSLDGGSCDVEEMQELLRVFLGWHAAVQQHLEARGYWCDCVDPRSGYALSGPPGGRRYDEVIGAEVLLGYVKQQLAGGDFCAIRHPRAGTRVYPATTFTNAPLPLLKEAAAAAARPPPEQQQQQQQQPSCDGDHHSHHQGDDVVGADRAAAAAAAADPCSPSSAAAAAAAAVAAAAAEDGAAAWLAGGGGGGGGLLPGAPAPACALLQLSDLSLKTPAGGWVVQGLGLRLVQGADLLVSGPSGCGKTTLVMCLAGLVRPQAGRVALLGGSWAPGRAGVAFLPQRALAAPGPTLRHQLLYPAAWPPPPPPTAGSGGDGPRRRGGGKQRRGGGGGALLPRCYAPPPPSASGPVAPPPPPPLPCEDGCGTDDARLLGVLAGVGLGYLVQQLGGLDGGMDDWQQGLSPGELQRLAVARALVRAPLLAVLDEATSSLDEGSEAQLYGALAAAGVTVVSTGHRPSLRRLHQRHLHLQGGGGGGFAWRRG